MLSKEALCVVCVCFFLPNIMAYYSDLCIHDWYVTDKLFFAALNSPQGDAPEILWHHPLQRGSLCTVSWTG